MHPKLRLWYHLFGACLHNYKRTVSSNAFLVPTQPCASGQIDFRVHHLHQLRAPSVRPGEHHLEHVYEEKNTQLERSHHGVFTTHLRRTRYVYV